MRPTKITANQDKEDKLIEAAVVAVVAAAKGSQVETLGFDSNFLDLNHVGWEGLMRSSNSRRPLQFHFQILPRIHQPIISLRIRPLHNPILPILILIIIN